MSAQPASTEHPIRLERSIVLDPNTIACEFSNRGGKRITINVPANHSGRTDIEAARIQAASLLWKMG